MKPIVTAKNKADATSLYRRCFFSLTAIDLAAIFTIFASVTAAIGASRAQPA